jgi:hypothetical protein
VQVQLSVPSETGRLSDGLRLRHSLLVADRSLGGAATKNDLLVESEVQSPGLGAAKLSEAKKGDFIEPSFCVGHAAASRRDAQGHSRAAASVRTGGPRE